MSINANDAANRVVKKLKSIGIDDQVGDKESHTAILVRLIIDAVLEEVVNNGEVYIRQLPVQTYGGPTSQAGFGNGKAGII